MLAAGPGMGFIAQTPADLAGTWTGLATMEGEDEPNELTLVLEMKEGELAGHMTDQFGAMNEAPVSELNYSDKLLTFSVTVESPQGTLTLNFKMTVSEESMEGTFDVPEMGVSGAWKAERQ